MNIEHPDITRINRFGYHDPEAFDYEMRLMMEEYTEDEEIWPDGLTWDEWKGNKKRSLGKVNAYHHHLAWNEG